MLLNDHLADLYQVYGKTRLDLPADRHIWGRRATLQLAYASKLCQELAPEQTELLGQALELAHQALLAEGAITQSSCLAVEEKLSPLAGLAKSLRLICIGHAHIDMNWMWSYAETVAVTLATLRTALDLLEEYPEFTFGQSQASVYQIVAQHEPALLEQIKHFIKQGRWEVTAATWTEADRNLASAESTARHYLYTRRYLAELLDLDPALLNLDYEPDTFGHHQNVPVLAASGQVDYYYHCRGARGPHYYRWQAAEGSSILVWREPLWYNWDMEGECALFAPQLAQETGLTSLLRVFGVGDHGGGPTRRDLENIRSMASWPIFPHYSFGTYREFFQLAAKEQPSPPLVTGELGFIFDGCYTSQARIKRGNALAQRALVQAEQASAWADLLTGLAYPAQEYAKAWQHVMFNQFHDILPGSGKAQTRDHALALYQEAQAISDSRQLAALSALSRRIDSSGLASPALDPPGRAEGAGAGFGTDSGLLGQVGRHQGRQRLFTVWNFLGQARQELVRLTLWDWPYDLERLQLKDSRGQVLDHQLETDEPVSYWGHQYCNILVRVQLPAAGYSTIILDQAPWQGLSLKAPEMRVLSRTEPVLENEYLCLQLCRTSGQVLSLLDKKTGQELVGDQAVAGFYLLDEDPGQGMTSWRVGDYKNKRPLVENVSLKAVKLGELRQQATFEYAFGQGSLLSVTYSLDQNQRYCRLDCQLRWQEIGNKMAMPQLQFYWPLVSPCAEFIYDIPLGEISRPALAHDVPALSYAAALQGNSVFQLVSDCKHGFRATGQGLSLSLVRASIDPDPWPEIGQHSFSLGLALPGQAKADPAQLAESFNNPLLAMPLAAGQAGDWPLEKSFFALTGQGIFLLALKKAESGQGLVLRLSCQSSQQETARLSFCLKPQSARLVDLLEEPVSAGEEPLIEGSDILLEMPPASLRTLLINW